VTRFLAQWWARRKYIWKQELEAVTEDLQASLSAQRAQEKRSAAVQLRKEAEDMEARVAQIAEMEDKGFWQCEDGHEQENTDPDSVPKLSIPCDQCNKPAKLVKRDLMTGQEKYESDKGRKEVETMIQNKRQTADQYDKDAQGGDDTAKHFRRQAASSREVADRLRKL
jgi:hypothetical protein